MNRAGVVKHLEHTVLVVIRGVPALEDPEEDLLDEDADLCPQVLLRRRLNGYHST